MQRVKHLLPVFLFSLCTATIAAAQADHPERIENGWYDPSFPVPVLHLEGTIEEVARAHGTLVSRQPEARATLDHFADAVTDRLAAQPFLARHSWLRGMLAWGYRHFVRNLIIDYVPDRYREAYSEFARAAGYDQERLLDALALPDASLRLLSLLYGLEAAPILPPTFGCSSIIWNSGPGTVLHGRNLDYDGVGFWEHHPLILHVIPNEGLAYVSVTSVGMHAPGLTAFNEAGLTLSVHQLTLTDTQASGTPVVVISAEVIRNARSIDDAIAIIRGFPRSGSWAYVLSQGRDRAVVETTANELAIRRSGEPFFFQTNHVSSPALAAEQIYPSPGYWLDTFARASRLSRLVQSGATQGWATPDRLAPMLGMGAVTGEASPPHRVAGGTIARLDNIQSVIMDASHRRLWVAVGDERHAPNESTYVEYRWSDLRSADAPELTGAEVSVVPAEALGGPNAKLRELLRQAMDKRKAAKTPDYRDRLYGEYTKLAGQSQPHPAPPSAGRWPGIYLYVWNALARGAAHAPPPETLLAQLESALRDPDLAPPAISSEITRQAARHRLALGRLTRARLLDLAGRRTEALYEYYVVTRTAGFERLKRAATRGLERAFDWSQAQATAIDYAGIDLYRY